MHLVQALTRSESDAVQQHLRAALDEWERQPPTPLQECPVCGHTTRANREGKRFKCKGCAFQDHADRKAAGLVSAKGLEKQNRNVPALNTFPWCGRGRCDGVATGSVNLPTTTRT